MTDSHPTIALQLAQLGLIEVRGADAAAFLQGQLSNDVRTLSATRAQLSSCNSPKGRMLAVLHVLRNGDGFLLELHRSVLDSVLKRLRMYVLRSKVTLAEATNRVTLGVAGPGAASLLGGLGLPAPAAPLECAWAGDAGVVRRLGATPRFTVLAPASRGAELWRDLAARARVAGVEDWKRLDIEAGVPTIYPETQDRFVAQMCNLDALGGISFDKGCYTGQEIIARVHYRGAVKRHMTVERLAQAAPAPGQALELPDGRRGEVVDAAPGPDGSWLVQAVLAGDAAH